MKLIIFIRPFQQVLFNPPILAKTSDACSKLFSDLNANVIITYNSGFADAEQTLNLLNSNQNHSLYQADIARPENVKQLFQQVMEKYERIDVLVNNAGVFIEHKIAEVSFEEWQQVWNETIATNLTGVSNLCYFAGKQMIKQNGGKINHSSFADK